MKFVYNEFKNAVTQKVDGRELSAACDEPPKRKQAQAADATTRSIIVKPSHEESSRAVCLAKHFAIQAFRMLLESQASEHGARMSAMENATKNAGEMIRKLTLQYNKQRQAGITKELLEIISAASRRKASK